MNNLYRPVPLIFALLLAATACSLDTAPPGGYAIVYGISLYDPEFEEGEPFTLNLTYSNDDAIAVASMLEDAGYEVIQRIDTQATLSNLTSDISYVSSHIGKEENFIYYFSGHGARLNITGEAESGAEPAGRDTYNEWIFLYGSINDSTLSDLDAALSDDQILSLIDGVPTDRKIVILDACNSGGFIGSEVEVDLTPQDSDGEPDERFLDAVRKYLAVPGSDAVDIPASEALVITAAGEQEDTYETSTYGHGVFTYHLLNSRQEADDNDDGFVTVGECVNYAAAMIEAWWTAPSFVPRISGGPIDFVLFRSLTP
jgi:hypothetical protein